MKTEKRKYRLKGHESFIPREGWLTKGLFAAAEKPGLFTENFGADELGVGTNMAKSIRYWLRTAGLTRETGKAQVQLTEFGRTLLQQDAYLEDAFSLWLIHCHIASNQEMATSWYFFFQCFDREEFTREQLERDLEEYLLEEMGAEELSMRSLQDDCDAILQMYGRKRSEETDPEEKKNSPFYGLGLVREYDGKFRMEQPDLDRLDELAVLYAMQDCLEAQEDYYSASLEKLLGGEGSPGKLLHLKKSFLLQYLERLEQKGYLVLNRTAGLDMVYQKEKFSGEQIRRDYFGRK